MRNLISGVIILWAVIIWGVTGMLMAARQQPVEAHEFVSASGAGIQKMSLTDPAPQQLYRHGWQLISAREGWVYVTHDFSQVGYSWDILRINLKNKRIEHLTLRNRNNALDMTFSPDGQWIVYISDGYLVKMRPDGSHVERLISDECYRYPSWSPDGTQIALLNRCDGMRPAIIPAEGGSPISLLTPDLISQEEACCIPVPPIWNGDWIIFGTIQRQHLILYRVFRNGGHLERISKPDLAADPRPMIASPDGQWIILHTLDGYMRLSSDGKRLEPFSQLEGGQNWFKWSSDGQWILTYTLSTTEGRVYRLRADGSDPQALTPPDEYHLMPLWVDPIEHSFGYQLLLMGGAVLIGIAIRVKIGGKGETL